MGLVRAIRSNPCSFEVGNYHPHTLITFFQRRLPTRSKITRPRSYASGVYMSMLSVESTARNKLPRTPARRVKSTSSVFLPRRNLECLHEYSVECRFTGGEDNLEKEIDAISERSYRCHLLYQGGRSFYSTWLAPFTLIWHLRFGFHSYLSYPLLMITREIIILFHPIILF